MRFLANERFPGDAVIALREAGQDVAWVRTDAPSDKKQTPTSYCQATYQVCQSSRTLHGR